MTLYVTNAFSINMLPAGCSTVAVFSPIRKTTAAELIERAKAAGDFMSAVGHKDTSAVFTTELGTEIKENRINVTLGPADVLIVGQYTGPRLPEGATTLPEGATITWWLVTARSYQQ